MASIGVRVIFLLFLVQFYVINTAVGVPKSGPYKTYLIRTERCKKTRYTTHPDPPLTLDYEVYNISSKTFFGGNFTIKRYVENVKIKVKSSIWENGKWKSNYRLPTTGCHGEIMQMIHDIFHVKYDEKYCAYYKANYIMRDVDANEFQHKLMSTAAYGRVLWSTEIYVTGRQFFTLACWEFEELTLPK